MRNRVLRVETTVPPSAESRASRQFIASLANGLRVLEALATHADDVSLKELADYVKQTKPTAWRLVHTLVKLGYVRQDPESKRFRLAPRILTLGASFEGMDLKELAGPYLRDLAARVGETVNMAVLDGDEIVYIERIKTKQIITINLHVGSRLPLYNTSMGRALVAHMPSVWLRSYLKRMEGDPAARRSLQDGGRRFLGILRETRESGYAVNDEDLASGLRSVAAPIWDHQNNVIAAVNIAVPSARVSIRDLRARYLPELLKTAGEICQALGFRGHPPPRH